MRKVGFIAELHPWPGCMRSGKVLVYAGKGSSHSWVWMADLLESGAGLRRRVRGRPQARQRARGGLVLLWSSPEATGSRSPRPCRLVGSRRSRNMSAVAADISARARARISPSPQGWNPSTGSTSRPTRIRNLVPVPDESVESSPRTGVRYGSCSIVHPVRGDVVVADGPSFLHSADIRRARVPGAEIGHRVAQVLVVHREDLVPGRPLTGRRP